jgi:hypothetical protein
MSRPAGRWLLLALLACAPLVLVWTGYWLAVDSCLDAGGSYDYRTAACDSLQSHPYVPFVTRYSVLLQLTAVTALALLAIAILTRWRSKQAAA